MSRLKVVQIVEAIASLNPNCVDGRCHFCKRRTADALDHHAVNCIWRAADKYVNFKKRYAGNTNN